MKTKNKFTPGPWYVSNHADNVDIVIRSQFQANGDIVANCETDFYGNHKDPQILANARLIAAAPKMLKALVECAELLKFMENDIPGGYSPDGALFSAMEAIKEAIGD
jgi:hypothetical protein